MLQTNAKMCTNVNPKQKICKGLRSINTLAAEVAIAGCLYQCFTFCRQWWRVFWLARVKRWQVSVFTGTYKCVETNGILLSILTKNCAIFHISQSSFSAGDIWLFIRMRPLRQLFATKSSGVFSFLSWFTLSFMETFTFIVLGFLCVALAQWWSCQPSWILHATCRCVLGPKTLPTLPTGGGQRVQWRHCSTTSLLSACPKAGVATT